MWSKDPFSDDESFQSLLNAIPETDVLSTILVDRRLGSLKCGHGTFYFRQFLRQGIASIMPISETTAGCSGLLTTKNVWNLNKAIISKDRKSLHWKSVTRM